MKDMIFLNDRRIKTDEFEIFLLTFVDLFTKNTIVAEYNRDKWQPFNKEEMKWQDKNKKNET